MTKGMLAQAKRVKETHVFDLLKKRNVVGGSGV